MRNPGVRDFQLRDHAFLPQEADTGMSPLSSMRVSWDASSFALGKVTDIPQSVGDDIADDTSSTTTLAIGGSVSTNLNANVDKDFFQVNLVAGQTYVFTMTRAPTAPALDTFLEIRSAGGVLITENDDGGIGTNSVLMYRATETGAHFLSAGSWNSASSGGYTVTAQAIETGPSTITSFPSNGKPQFSWTEAAYQLTREGASWAANFGQSAVVTYSFRADAPATMPSDTTGFSRFNATQIGAVEAALQAWGQVANITFVRVGAGTTGEAAYSNDATMVFANYSGGQAGASAFAYLPTSAATASSSVQGDVWVNNSIATNANPVSGEVGYNVLMHEIGHALGLSHPGEYDAEEGVSITYAANAEYQNDSRLFTVMSYFGTTAVGGGWPVYPGSPQMHDIAAVQRLYGANTSTRTGDTVYGFNSNTSRPEFTITSAAQAIGFTVWDGGGNDTLDFSGFAQNANIDLREESFMNVGPGGPIYNVVIARGSVIENAIGGGGADSITGNATNNVIDGRAGADSLFGLSGNDAILGGTGDDQIWGGEGDDWMDGQSGADQMWGGAGNDAFLVDSASDVVSELSGEGYDGVYATVSYDLSNHVEELWFTSGTTIVGRGNGLSNVIRGSWLGTNELYGLGGDDNIAGGTLGDVLEGGDGDDWIGGFGGNDVIRGGAGADGLVGYEGDDVIYGEDGTGVLVGLEGNDQLFGGAAFDYMVGGTGSDRLEGFGGDDYYVLEDGLDTLVEALDGGTDTVWTTASWTLGANFEHMFLQGGGAVDATGNGLANTLRGNDAANVLRGLGGNDDLAAAGGNDRLEGGDGADYLNGGDGADVLVGGAGADTLVGGAGADTFVYLAASESTAASRDGIYEFTRGSDLIDLSALRTGSSDTYAFTASNGSTLLNVDLGGDGTVDLSVFIDGVTGLGASDIIWTASSSPADKGEAAAEVLPSDLRQEGGGVHDLLSDLTVWRADGRGGEIAVLPQAHEDLVVLRQPDSDLAEGAGRGANSYTQSSFNEGRVRNAFDAAQYLANYADLQAAFGDDLYNATRHYILFGYAEGRTDADLSGLGGTGDAAMFVGVADKGGDPGPEILMDAGDIGALSLAVDDGVMIQGLGETPADLRAKSIVMPPEWAVLSA